MPIQVEMDESTSIGQLSTEKNGNQSDASPNDSSDVYYIPLGGQEGKNFMAKLDHMSILNNQRNC